MASKTRTAAVGCLVWLLVASCSGSDDGAGPEPTDAPGTTAAATTTSAVATTEAPSTSAVTESTEPAGTGEDSGDFEVTECPFAAPGGVDVICGTLYVPENRSIADSPWIALAVAIVSPDGPLTGPPVVYLSGGPGGSGLDDFDADPQSWEYPFLEGRELVLLDQRGTGYSQPTLDCPEITDDAPPGEAERACFEPERGWPSR